MNLGKATVTQLSPTVFVHSSVSSPKKNNNLPTFAPLQHLKVWERNPVKSRKNCLPYTLNRAVAFTDVTFLTPLEKQASPPSLSNLLSSYYVQALF